MSSNKIVNITASVRARLLHRAKTDGRPFSEVLQYYAMERFLHRLSKSAYAEQFILKGGLMLQFWGGSLSRSTKDIDLHKRSIVTSEEFRTAIKDILMTHVEDDGLEFDRKTLTLNEIRLAASYKGVRAQMQVRLGRARIALQIDLGFGDIITPGAQLISYPSLLSFRASNILGYPPETTIAEKFEAMVLLDLANTRMKDFIDLWVLLNSRNFDGIVLSRATKATFHRRGTPLPQGVPVALTEEFVTAKAAQWKAYVRKNRLNSAPELSIAVEQIRGFLMPVVEASLDEVEFAKAWDPELRAWK